MCGIVGILGDHEAAPILLDGLKRLEYRGYDSAGIATLDAGRLDRRRAVGKLANLSDLLVHEPIRGKAGIGHTRWATHGAPTVDNAHPHQAGPVAVVHNGIIENYRNLRKELIAEAGARFVTETDTETVVRLCAYYLDQGLNPVDAARKTVNRLEGAYALVFLFDGWDDLLVATRKGSPLAVGHGEGEMFVGSDALALAPMTQRVTYLEEGDFAVITRAGAQISDRQGVLVNRELHEVSAQAQIAEKGPHKHFMAKEIAEQPQVLAEAVKAYAARGAREMAPRSDLDFAPVDRLTLVACGTAYLACMVAKYWFEQLARLPVEIDIASEFRYREPPMSPAGYAVFVSQSGETADTLAALRYVDGKVARTVAVVNVAESSISRECDVSLPIMAGPEIGVASTKAFTCQLAVLFSLAVTAARQRGHLEAEGEARLVSQFQSLPGLLNLALGQEATIKGTCLELAQARDALFLGRGLMYPLALEGALKLKEISYIHAEGYASGELKHGPIALVDEHMPVIVMAPRDDLFDKTVSNMQEVMARGGRIILITDASGAAEAGEGVWTTVTMPTVPAVLAPIVYAVPAQLLAYHTAVTKGTDVDQPRNLAKSVTVE